MIILHIKVIPNAKKSSIVEENGRMKVHLTAPAVDGKANDALISFLAKHYKVKSHAVTLLKGFKNREKLVQIDLPTE